MKNAKKLIMTTKTLQFISLYFKKYSTTKNASILEEKEFLDAVSYTLKQQNVQSHSINS